MLGEQDIGFHFISALEHSVKVLNFKPQQCAVSVWPILGVADSSMVMFCLETVEL